MPSALCGGNFVSFLRDYGAGADVVLSCWLPGLQTVPRGTTRRKRAAPFAHSTLTVQGGHLPRVSAVVATKKQSPMAQARQICVCASQGEQALVTGIDRLACSHELCCTAVVVHCEVVGAAIRISCTL